MKKKDWYENWFSSAYYKILYRDRDDAEAEQFVETLIKHLQPLPGSRMLDIACGEGRHSRQLAEHGYDVTGIDLSYQCIRQAKLQEHDHLHFLVHDMRFPFYINYFDFSFNFFTSFGYFASNRDNVMAAKSFAAGLKKNGTLVIDYLNSAYILEHLVPEAQVTKEGLIFDIKKKVIDKHIIKDITITDKEGEQHHYAERVAAFTLSDFLEIFKKAGLTLTGTFGDYNMNPYDPVNSKRLIMIFKK
ncbi:MAG: methyltransferase domain-containing protein [Chitinophagaceae bacterium]|nr:methyltransferase domain-containing protein [Chitinophagaceae bacterium]MCB9045757.1 methyltransferase domain-containing protein [Chitinophagales bacterium]